MAKERYECTTGGSNKFWEVEVVKNELIVRFGKIGTEGQTNEKTFTSKAEAQKALDKLKKEKLGKGYTLKRTLTIEFATYAQNGYDGSVSVEFFKDAELAEKAAEKDDERYSEDVASHEIEIDLETGKIISGVKTKVDDD